MANNKPIDKSYLVKQLKNYETEIIDKKYVAKDSVATTLEEEVTDEQVASALLTKTELDKKVDKTSIVTELSEESTDDKVVGALTTYNELQKLESANKEQFATANGNFITANDSVDGNIVDLKLYGKSEQKQYNGKNLFDPNKIVSNQVSYKDGIIDITQTDGSELFDITFKENTQYTISAYASYSNTSGGSLAINCIRVRYTDGSTEAILGGFANGVYNFKTYTSEENKTIKSIINSQQSGHIKLDKLQIEEGTEATSYEPYVGEIPSPNPDYPQEIKSVVNPKLEVCGKNLFNIDDGNISNSLLNNSGITSPTYIWLTTDFIKVKPNTTYALSIEDATDNCIVRFSQYDTNKKNIENVNNILGVNGNTTKIITTKLATQYIRLSFGRNDKATTVEQWKEDGHWLQIEENNQVTSYEPYQGNQATLPYTLNAIPVSSGGNVTIGGQQYVSDYVDVERGKLVKMVDSSKLDNTQSIVDKTEWLLAEPQEIDLIQKEVQAFKALATYYPTTNISVNSDQLDGYAELKYPTTDVSGLVGRNESRIAKLAKDTDDKFDEVNESLSVIGKCKNLLNPTLQTTTHDGITCTNNGDGTYTLNGTCSVDSPKTTIILTSESMKIDEDVKFICCTQSGSSDTFRASVDYDDGTYSVDYGEGTLLSKGKTITKVSIIVSNGATVNNLVFKPMLTTNLSATYDDFVPYTGDGETLTHDVAEIKNDLVASNAGAHNSIYRGKYLGNALTIEQKAQISAGTFNDLYIGDYWAIGGVNYRIAAFDYWLNSGDTQCTKHHVVIVPDTGLYTAKMNTTNVTTGAYIGSEMYTTNLEQAKTIINEAFGSANILSHREFLANATKATTDPTYESAGSWYDSTVELMNERMVYGADVFHNIEVNGAIPMNYTIDKSQLPLFALEPSRICNRVYWWLRDVVSAAYFASVAYDGFAAYNATSNSLGVRPAFGITCGAASYNVSDSDSDDVSTTFGITG